MVMSLSGKQGERETQVPAPTQCRAEGRDCPPGLPSFPLHPQGDQPSANKTTSLEEFAQTQLLSPPRCVLLTGQQCWTGSAQAYKHLQ